MTSSLGIFVNDNIVKYAKLTKTTDGSVEINEHGIKFVKNTLKDTIQSIVQDPTFDKLSIYMNNLNVNYVQFQISKLTPANLVTSAINIEFEEWCETSNVGPSNYSYVYNLSENATGDYFKGIMAITEKNRIEELKNYIPQIQNIYPEELLSSIVVPEEELNYSLVDLSDKLYVTTVVNKKIKNISVFDVCMKQIFEKLVDLLGTYQKAYDACKELNVFSDDSSYDNKVQMEEIVEPILQEILHNVSDCVMRDKDIVSKIILTGTGTLFINIDTLFSEFLGMKAEILKPKFIIDMGGVRNIAETLEILPAAILAKQGLLNKMPNLEFMKKSSMKKKLFKNIFSKKMHTVEKKQKIKDTKVQIINNFSFSKVLEYGLHFIVVTGLILIGYLAFSNIYVSQVNSSKKQLESKTKNYNEQLANIKADQKIIETSMGEYKSVNDEVDKIKQQIETNQIGKFSTYNVAAFMQKIIKIIPSNVKLNSISSNDNKKVVIKAESNAYPNLGYFVAQLRLQPDILKNVVINSVSNGDNIIIEIGGDLP